MPEARRLWVLVAGLALSVAGCSQADRPPSAARSDRQANQVVTPAAPTPAPAPPHPVGFTAADAVVASVALYDAPGAPTSARSLSNPTWEGVPLAFLVRGQEGEWLQVALPMRPNGATGWIRSADVSLRTVPHRVVIEVGARRLKVFNGDAVLLDEPVAVGTDRTPTPTGDFYLDATVKLDDTSGAYGAYQLSVSGFSNVLQTFGSGIGQIAVHGTNQPGLIGQAVSNGCVRMTNAAVTRVAQLAPVGTPVQIVA